MSIEEINAPNLEVLSSPIRASHSLKKFYAPKLTELPANCFMDCYNLEEIYTPSLLNVQAGGGALRNCYSLKKIIYAEGCNFNGNMFETCHALYPKPQ